MSDAKPSENKPKKVVNWKSVAIALGIICIILVAGLGATIEYYTIAISDKNNTIARLNESLNLASSTVLADEETITQTAGNYTSWTFMANVTGYIYVWFPFSKNFPNNTYVRVIYNGSLLPTQYQYEYDTQVNSNNVSTNGYGSMGFTNQIVFPVLLSFVWFGSPSSNNLLIGTSVEVRVGNTNTVGNATERVTITYYY